MLRKDMGLLDLELLALKVKLKMGDSYNGSPVQVIVAALQYAVQSHGSAASASDATAPTLLSSVSSCTTLSQAQPCSALSNLQLVACTCFRP